MWEVTERMVVGTPPDRVWGVVTDVSRHADLAGSGELRALRRAVRVLVDLGSPSRRPRRTALDPRSQMVVRARGPRGRWDRR